MYIKRKIFTLFFFTVLSLTFCYFFSPVFAQDARSLPEVPNWVCGELRETNLETVSGNQGIWLQRDYRSDEGATIRATLMAGKGPRMLRFPPENLDVNDGPLGSGCTYRTLEIRGRKAVVETHPLLGVSVFVNLGDGYLTLERSGYGLSESDVIPATITLLDAM